MVVVPGIEAAGVIFTSAAASVAVAVTVGTTVVPSVKSTE
jgi:hypothetical protein